MGIMATRCWGQETTVDHAGVLMALAACGSLQKVVTVVMPPSRSHVSATGDTEVKTLFKLK